MKGTGSTSNHTLPLPPESWEEVRSRLGLTPREFEIALLLLAGHTEKGTAKAL
jgi:DNA-binding NarL/FixJ family response regulator